MQVPRRVLADTHILIWYADDKLPRAARTLMQNVDVQMYFSLESIREIAIKVSLGKPDFNYSAMAMFEGLLANGWIELPVRAEHIIALENLPLHHRDPFDRMLVAQALVDQLTLLTVDKHLSRYDVPILAAG